MLKTLEKTKHDKRLIYENLKIAKWGRGGWYYLHETSIAYSMTENLTDRRLNYENANDIAGDVLVAFSVMKMIALWLSMHFVPVGRIFVVNNCSDKGLHRTCDTLLHCT